MFGAVNLISRLIKDMDMLILKSDKIRSAELWGPTLFWTVGFFKYYFVSNIIIFSSGFYFSAKMCYIITLHET